MTDLLPNKASIKIGKIEVRLILRILREVSDRHFKRHRRIWTVYEQLNHTHSEVSELYEALRSTWKEDSGRESIVKHLVEEIWDIVFSALTNAHVLGITDHELLEGLDGTLEKIAGRVELKL